MQLGRERTQRTNRGPTRVAPRCELCRAFAGPNIGYLLLTNPMVLLVTARHDATPMEAPNCRATSEYGGGDQHDGRAADRHDAGRAAARTVLRSC